MKKIIALLLVSSFAFTACSESKKESKNDIGSTEVTKNQHSSEKTLSSKQTKANENFDFKNEEVEIKINGITSGKGMDDTDVVFVDYSAKNKANVAVEAQDLFMYYITAYQNNAKLEFGYVDSTNSKYEAVNKLSQEVYPNEKIQASFTYKLNDTETPLELRFHDRNTDDIIKTENYEIK